VKKLIVVIGLVFSLISMAQTPIAETSWKMKIREIITSIAGEEWSNKILGEPPVINLPDLVLPEIPKQFKKSTDIGSYSKKTKSLTEFDKLPLEKKRQFDYKFIEELFQVTRKAEAKDEDVANWLNTLAQGGSREGIYQALVLDEVYNGMESMEEKPTKKLLDFCLQYSQKFHHETFRPESLNQLNLYSLKRIFTEKGLDLLEYYEVKDLDSLYRWYAVLSADLAKNDVPFMKSQIRKNQSAKYHYEWAKSMPIQHIKSEYVIKMHSVMNGLQLITQ
jgi:hypothetical protein